MIEKLGSDAYPDRVSAERELRSWAESGGEAARKWLIDQCRTAENPEVRSRSLAALKAVVLKDLTKQRPGFVGIGMGSVKTPEEHGGKGFGVEVQAVNPGTPADKAGLRVTDVILKLDGKGWADPNAQHEFAGRIGKMRGGDKIRLELLRNGKKEEVDLTLASRPWSAGVYSENLQLRGDPFAARSRLPRDEKHAENQAFQDWLERQEAGRPVR
ncbi:MAG: PDZ domain-containing protein [Haloferula sp.]|uniref:PDZ domain-containing protein n=1 Tax=Haloferula sp. TaxID=2497595 RepID=UPI00329E0D1C